jgi:hypothetical protein
MTDIHYTTEYVCPFSFALISFSILASNNRILPLHHPQTIPGTLVAHNKEVHCRRENRKHPA